MNKSVEGIPANDHAVTQESLTDLSIGGPRALPEKPIGRWTRLFCDNNTKAQVCFRLCNLAQNKRFCFLFFVRTLYIYTLWFNNGMKD